VVRVENPKPGKPKASNCRVPKERDWRRTKFFDLLRVENPKLEKPKASTW